ncbi:MAPK regulated corepressor interacting protein 2 isoform X2 [Rhinatrema bivittatum]|uniref:MAPK regulated corepressor interacting protein 2 isoform X2 n=1 Tax=Rhinatrema bivittatum TaxID=194408 RepID=UPI001126527A|nr:MAPK regulated corepressor interacting protein 2 isoform X2 [Rhinatrema bivittatum]
MYTITRGPSKLATQRRTGPTQQIESKLGDLKYKAPSSPCASSPWPLASNPAPKLVFNRVNGKRHQVAAPQPVATEECYTLAHEENVRFVHEAWQEVEQQLDDSQQGKNGRGPVQYVEKTPNPTLKNFVPIDLEEWWAQRFLANIENCS